MSAPTDGRGRIRILLVDDHAMVRRGMRDFLGLHDGSLVVGEASDGIEALEATERLAPDVVIMDLLMPRMDGIAATAEIKARHPSIEVVALTSFIDEDRVTAALEAGASGFLLKDAEADELAAAIRAAIGGEVHLDPAVAGIVAARHARTIERCGGRPGDRGRSRDHGPWPSTGPCGAGGADRPRASRCSRGSPGACRTGRSPTDLGITERTARTHVSNILAKLGLTSRTQAALFAVQHGLGTGG